MMTPALMELYAFLDALAGRRRRQGHRSLQAGEPGPQRHGRAPPGADPDRGDARSDEPELHALVQPGRRHLRRARSPGCTGIRSSTRRARITLHYLLYGSLDGRKSRPGSSARRMGGTAAAPQLTAVGLHRLEDGDDPRAAGGRGDDAVLRSADAARGGRARAAHAARRLLHHAGVLRQLADQHQQPDARHDEPDADRRARRAGRRHRRHRTPASPPPGLDTAHAARRRPASPATRRSIRRARSSRRPTRGTTTSRSTRRSPRRRGCSRSRA